MDARNIGIKAIKEGIEKGWYELTGVLETGELVIALMGDPEKSILKDVCNSNKSNSEKLEEIQHLIEILGRPADELLQVYEQNTCSKNQRCLKNGLRLRK